MKDNGTIASRTVDILVATYNGEKYIRAQLLSLLFQTHANIRVLVHDDGSTDKTCEIIREIARVDSRVVLIEDGVRCGGAGKNFMHLLKFSKAEAVMFCDQDDIWFDNKVSEMLEVLQEKDPRIPQVVYSEAYAWYTDRGIDGKAMATHPRDLRRFLFLNGAFQGCATIFNGAMRRELARWQGPLWMHDHTLALIGLTMGEVTYMPEALMLYRRHPDSVTGGSALRSTLRTAFVTHRQSPVVCQGAYDAVRLFLIIYGRKLSQKNRELLSEYLAMPEKSFLGRALSIVRNGFMLHGSTAELLFKLVLRPYMKNVTLGGVRSLDLIAFFAANANFEVAA